MTSLCRKAFSIFLELASSVKMMCFGSCFRSHAAESQGFANSFSSAGAHLLFDTFFWTLSGKNMEAVLPTEEALLFWVHATK